MSLSPYFFDYDLPQWPRRLIGQNFGLTLDPDAIVPTPVNPMFSRLRPWWPKEVDSSIKSDKDKFQINVDVQHFSPEEISVKVADGYVMVEGKHEEKKDEHGYISRQFVRRFKLPEDSDPDAVQSRLSSDGVLSVLAPRKGDKAKGERAVPIAHTGPVRKEVTDLPKTEESKEQK